MRRSPDPIGQLGAHDRVVLVLAVSFPVDNRGKNWTTEAGWSDARPPSPLPMTRRVLRSFAPSLVFLAVIVALAFSVFGATRDSEPVPQRADAGSRRMAAGGSATPAHSAAAREPGQVAPVNPWQRQLMRLDRWRTAAWRRGDVELLRRVYTASSSGLAAERRMLDRYRDRGLRVTGVRLTFGHVAVLERAPRRVVLDVIDQLGMMRAVSTGRPPVSLPRDQPSHHHIELRRVTTGWLIASIETA